jgi:hypothetical protein
MKICKECGEPKERSEFHKHAGSADGLQAKCKVCRHAASAVYRSTRKAEIQQRDAAYYYANREKISERDKRRNALPHRRAAHALASKRYREANRLKLQAQQMVHKALLDGALVKPKVCSRCPETNRRCVFARAIWPGIPSKILPWLQKQLHLATLRIAAMRWRWGFRW